MLQIARNQRKRTYSRRLINATGSTAAVRSRNRRVWCDTSRGGTWSRPRRTRTVTVGGCSGWTGTRSAKARRQGMVSQASRRVARTNSPVCGKGVRARDPSTRDTNCSFTCGYIRKRSRTNVRSVSLSRLILQRLQIASISTWFLRYRHVLSAKIFCVRKKNCYHLSVALYRFMLDPYKLSSFLSCTNYLSTKRQFF